LVLPVKDIETVASVIQTTGKAVMLWFYFNNSGEWVGVPEIKDPNLDISQANRHSVAGVDAVMYEGKKAIIIEDSWGSTFGFHGQRVITEDFFKARNFFAAYPINFKF